MSLKIRRRAFRRFQGNGSDAGGGDGAGNRGGGSRSCDGCNGGGGGSSKRRSSHQGNIGTSGAVSSRNGCPVSVAVGTALLAIIDNG